MQLSFYKCHPNSQAFEFIKLSLLVTFIFALLLCCCVYLFIDFQLTGNEAITLFAKTFMVTWIFIVGLVTGFQLLTWSIEKAKNSQFIFAGKRLRISTTLLILLVVAIFLASCNGYKAAGINKDLNTGMVTTYSNLKPEESVLVMNEEKLGHTQIPLGEKFIVINNKVKGLVIKDNKVSIGCSLKITNNTGKVLLNDADLFKDDGGIYDKKDAEYLKCTISTGKPMNWDEDYKVMVKFWDKYGTGSIENKFTISIVDVP